MCRTVFFLSSSPENRCQSSTIDLQNPQCPICQVPLNGQDMHTHVQQELDTIERNRQQQRYSMRRSSHLANPHHKVCHHLFERYKLIIIDCVYTRI